MKRSILILALAMLPVLSARGDYLRVDGEHVGHTYSLLRPDGADWNQKLVLLVHGSIPQVFESLAPVLLAEGFGVAFVTLADGTGEGAALKQTTLQTRFVQTRFAVEFAKPRETYLLAFSRGAHTMQKLLETSPVRYSGALSVCGGNGGSQLQWDYFFTARLLFDHYFPGVLPGTPTRLPEISVDEFLGVLAPKIAGAVFADLGKAQEMASVDQYALAYSGPFELAEGIVFSLAVHTIGVNGLIEAANGIPFDNRTVEYAGTGDDQALNAQIARIAGDQQAHRYLDVWYEPRGSTAGTPVLLLHTARDPGAPEALNNDRYSELVAGAGNQSYIERRVIDRFGHCVIDNAEVASALADLVGWAERGAIPSN
ncbi:MAG: hypothetical protein P8172_01450 [Gammaproteobacteria bacterium]